jgi:hypothetical protein
MAVAAGLTALASVVAATVIRVREPAPAAMSLTRDTPIRADLVRDDVE